MDESLGGSTNNSFTHVCILCYAKGASLTCASSRWQQTNTVHDAPRHFLLAKKFIILKNPCIVEKFGIYVCIYVYITSIIIKDIIMEIAIGKILV